VLPRPAESLFLSPRIDSSVVAVDLKPKATPDDAARTDDGARTVRDRLRAALPDAMKARDSVAVAALRSALGAIDNAEAVDAAQAPQPGVGHARLAGTVGGLRATEVARRRLTAAEMDEVVRAEVADRHAAVRDYERAGHRVHAERLRGEAAVLSCYLGGGEAPAS
jgi:uncharacterized protein YqeY